MKGQSSAEMLILLAAIIITVTSILYLSMGSNESAVTMQAARDGGGNAAAAMATDYGCLIDVEGVSLTSGTITINVAASNVPPEKFTWDNFRENIIKKNVRDGALRQIHNALLGSFPATAEPVKTGYRTYDVTVQVRLVTR